VGHDDSKWRREPATPEAGGRSRARILRCGSRSRGATAWGSRRCSRRSPSATRATSASTSPYHLLEEDEHEFAHPPTVHDDASQLRRSIELAKLLLDDDVGEDVDILVVHGDLPARTAQVLARIGA
jgi:hypothetical protein